MEPELWQRIIDLFNEAIMRGPKERIAFLARVCEGDRELRKQVERLLKSRGKSGDFLEFPAFAVAPELLTNQRIGALVGQSIGHYRVESLLGVGGMGEVYLARDERLGRKLALKFLPESLTANEAQLSRLEHEARTASALNHPNILTVYEIGVDGSQHFIATEFIEGETLRTALTRGKLELREALNIAIQVGSALAAAHNGGVLHRDVKPENIMLRPDGYAKVLDFGIAKLIEQRPASHKHDVGTMAVLETRPGLVIGTARYMSPEQARAQRVDARTDIWSLGVVLYEMVAGTPPFQGGSPSDCIASILKTEPPHLPDVLADVPKKLQSIVDKALRKEREERYQTMNEMLADLRSFKEQTEAAAFFEPIFGKIKRHKRGVFVTLMAALFGAGALVYHLYSVSSVRSVTEKSIAVLPFSDLSPTRDQAYFCDGIQDEILTRLSKVRDLKVISRTSTQPFKTAPEDLRKIARRLGVANILEGTVQKTADQVRVNVQLINARNDSHVWSDTYDRKLTDIFAVETDIAKTVANSLQVNLTRSERQAIAVRPTANPEAYELYLKGRFFWNKRTGADLRKAIDYLNHAIAKDPKYALAYAGLADCYDLLHEYSELSPKESYPKAKAAATKALELDDTLGEAHTSLAYSLINYDWDWRSAEREYQRAIQLNPNYATAHQWYAECLSILGRHIEAIAEIKRAQQLDPLSLIINQGVGGKYLYARRYDEAMAQFQRTLELYPHFAPTHQRLGWCYSQKRMYDEAIAEMQRAVELSGNSTQMVAALGYAHAAAGRRDTAQAIIGELERRSKERYVDNYFVATIFAALGKKDEAFVSLKKACAQRSYWMPWLNIDFQLDNLRSDPRFDELGEGVFAVKE
jgi:serine/threonine-protein kinase